MIIQHAVSDLILSRNGLDRAEFKYEATYISLSKAAGNQKGSLTPQPASNSL